jgi:hypothetical protein
MCCPDNERIFLGGRRQERVAGHSTPVRGMRSEDVRGLRWIRFPGVCALFSAVDELLEGPSITVCHPETGAGRNA